MAAGVPTPLQEAALAESVGGLLFRTMNGKEAAHARNLESPTRRHGYLADPDLPRGPSPVTAAAATRAGPTLSAVCLPCTVRDKGGCIVMLQPLSPTRVPLAAFRGTRQLSRRGRRRRRGIIKFSSPG